jgi:homoserine dehydrogenase
VLLELSPQILTDGQPGLGAVRTIAQGMHIVLVNKGPLVLAYRASPAAQRKHVARIQRVGRRRLPTVNIGRRDSASPPSAHRGHPGGTTNFIITSMAENGMSYERSRSHRNGIAETDPTLDVAGYDAANKLLILAHAALDYHVMPRTCRSLASPT